MGRMGLRDLATGRVLGVGRMGLMTLPPEGPTCRCGLSI